MEICVMSPSVSKSGHLSPTQVFFPLYLSSIAHSSLYSGLLNLQRLFHVCSFLPLKYTLMEGRYYDLVHISMPVAHWELNKPLNEKEN